ncbi:hypothetical protein KEM56_005014 [Ascosphaera pollenicola]|nr:hypothetical protein KEM56_005014 [Ascosphaera pollenicola]
MSSSNPRPSRKPKLSLQTASVPRTFGKSTTSLTLNISSDPSLSPTVRNTFCNAYDSQRRDDAGPIVSSSSLSSTSTTSSSSSFSLSSPSRCGGVEVAEVPYKLPRSARSILRNSPLGHARRSSHLRESSSLKNAYASSTTTTTTTTTTTVATRKPLFAPKKQVRYRTPLQEDIKTVDYVARHSDLYVEAESDSSDISAFSSPEVGSDDDSQSDSNAENHPSLKKSEMVKERAPKPMLPNIARQLRTAVSCNTSQPGSPITTTSQLISTLPFHPQPRKKKSQKWRWTLGPVMDGRVLPGPNPEETEDARRILSKGDMG